MSQVRSPKPTGFPGSRATRLSPSVAALQTYSKCGVPPRIARTEGDDGVVPLGQRLGDDRQLHRPRGGGTSSVCIKVNMNFCCRGAKHNFNV